MQQVKASVQPHNHTQEFGGPVDVAIGVRVQPPLLRNWNTKQKPDFTIEQPDPDSNLTLIKILFSKNQKRESHWHRANVYRKTNHRRQVIDEFGRKKEIEPGGVLVVAIKGRYTNQLDHPLPLGKYEGTCQEGEGWVLFTLQARTLVRQNVEQKRNILQPGDFEYQQTKEAIGGITPSPNPIFVP